MKKEITYETSESSYRVILTSKGLNTVLGTALIEEALRLLKRVPQNETILLVVPEDYIVQDLLVESCRKLGFREENIWLSRNFEGMEGRTFSVCYVTEGNTFEVLDYMRKKGLTGYVKDCVRKGGTYIGSSAGALIAGKDIYPATDFDANFCGIREFESLDLLDGTVVIPHYTYQQLRQYLSMFGAKERYKNMKNVADNEVLIYEVVEQGGVQCITKKKRIREDKYEGYM